MIDDAMRGARVIGMIQPAGGPEKALTLYTGVGCQADRLYAETEDGRMVITLRGICRFRLGEELTAMTPYRQARADFCPFAADPNRGDAAAEAMFDRPLPDDAEKAYLRAIQAADRLGLGPKRRRSRFWSTLSNHVLAPLGLGKTGAAGGRLAAERAEGAHALMELPSPKAAAVIPAPGGGQ